MAEITKTMLEQDVEKFLRHCSKRAASLFKGETDMTQEGFETSLEEMVSLNLNRLFQIFSVTYPEFMERFEREAEELEKKEQGKGAAPGGQGKNMGQNCEESSVRKGRGTVKQRGCGSRRNLRLRYR